MDDGGRGAARRWWASMEARCKPQSPRQHPQRPARRAQKCGSCGRSRDSGSRFALVEIRPHTRRRRPSCPIRKRSLKPAEHPTDATNKSTIAQGKPVARRGRKARDLSETARLPTSTDSAWSAWQMEVLRCPYSSPSAGPEHRGQAGGALSVSRCCPRPEHGGGWATDSE
jgi:hypothetical protein